MISRTTIRLAALLLAFAMATSASAQDVNDRDTAEVWRTFASRLDAGTAVKVRLRGGERFSATVLDAAPEALVLQRRTRVPVPVQRVVYTEIASIERDERSGIGVGKSIAIGAATGAGAFVALLFVAIASLSD